MALNPYLSLKYAPGNRLSTHFILIRYTVCLEPLKAPGYLGESRQDSRQPSDVSTP